MSTSVLYDAPGPKARRRSRIASVIGVAVVLAGFAWVVWTLAQPRVNAGGKELPGLFDPSRWDIFAKASVWRMLVVDGLLKGTLKAAVVASVLALLFGVVMSFARSARSAWIRVPTMVVLEFFRGMPVLLMMLFILLVFRGVGAYWSVVIALTVYNGTLIGEALRSGIASLPRGQREAGLSVGLSPVRTRLTIEFPQAFRQMLPVIIAQLVVLLKDTSLGYIVGYVELLRIGTNRLGSSFGSSYAFSLFFVVLGLYLTVNLTMSWLARWTARRLKVSAS